MRSFSSDSQRIFWLLLLETIFFVVLLQNGWVTEVSCWHIGWLILSKTLGRQTTGLTDGRVLHHFKTCMLQPLTASLVWVKDTALHFKMNRKLLWAFSFLLLPSLPDYFPPKTWRLSSCPCWCWSPERSCCLVFCLAEDATSYYTFLESRIVWEIELLLKNSKKRLLWLSRKCVKCYL